MNVLEKINLNTQFRLRKNCEYTLVLRNKTQEQEDEDSLKQLYVLFGEESDSEESEDEENSES